MRDLETFVLDYLINSFWQVPLVFVAGWMVGRLLRPAGLPTKHRVWISVLVLETTLPACSFHPGDLYRSFISLLGEIRTPTKDGIRVDIGTGSLDAKNLLHLPKELLTLLLVLYGLCLLYFVGRLIWGLWRTTMLRQQSVPQLLTDGIAESWNQLASLVTEATPELAVSTEISGPVTLGLKRPLLLVPPGFLEKAGVADLDALFAHEFAHIRRHDFAKNLFYELISLPVTYHPLVWLTRSRLAETREMLCDAMAAETLSGSDSYARSLLRLAAMLTSRMSDTTSHAIGIFDANSFERRIMNLTEKGVEVRGTKRAVIVTTCGALAMATCASALTLRMNVGTLRPVQTANQSALQVASKDLKVLSRKDPVYPAEATASKDVLNGPVVLRVIIGKDGLAQAIRITKSLRADYDRSALDSVRDWKWQPYLLDGNPIKVSTTVTVTFQLEP
ncbi:MAG TPA: M56 family metallopeptidase [Edaphobacter sp.]|nr:M56 family metallopeptidase [Edaphobacter sp.]